MYAYLATKFHIKVSSRKLFEVEVKMCFKSSYQLPPSSKHHSKFLEYTAIDNIRFNPYKNIHKNILPRINNHFQISIQLFAHYIDLKDNIIISRNSQKYRCIFMFCFYITNNVRREIRLY